MTAKVNRPYLKRPKTWDISLDPIIHCIVCGIQMFRSRLANGRVQPGLYAFTEKKFCSDACMSLAYTNTMAHPFQLLSPSGNTRWLVDDVGCWIWQLGNSDTGYGTAWTGLKVMGAHRWAYESLIAPVPEGLELDHLCRKRGCVNPVHLEPVTHKVNSRRGLATILSRDNVVQIKTLLLRGMSQKEVALMMGVSKQCIGSIGGGNTWKDVQV